MGGSHEICLKIGLINEFLMIHPTHGEEKVKNFDCPQAGVKLTTELTLL